MPQSNKVSIATEPNKPVKMGTTTVIGATPITVRSQPTGTVRNIGAKGVPTGATVGLGAGMGRATVIPVTKSNLTTFAKGIVSKNMKALTKPAAKVITGASIITNSGDVSRSVRAPSSSSSSSTVPNAKSLSSAPTNNRNAKKGISNMPAPEPVPSKKLSNPNITTLTSDYNSTKKTPQHLGLKSTATAKTMPSPAQQSGNETKGPPKPSQSVGLSYPTNILPQPLHNPEVKTVIQDILLLLQIYGPLTLYQLEYNLPPYKSSTLTDRMRDLNDILDMLVVVGVLHYILKDDEKDKSTKKSVEESSLVLVKEENDFNDTSKIAQTKKEELETTSDCSNSGRYVYCSGRLRAPGDIVYPWEILDHIQEANVEIRERRERIECLRKELLMSTPFMSYVDEKVLSTRDDTKQDLNSKAESVSNEWDTLFRSLQDRDIKSGGNLPPKDTTSSNQRIKATREFFKAMLEKYPDIGQDPVYVAAMRNFNVDWGAAGRGSRGQSGNRKKVNSSGGGTSGKKRRSSSSSKPKVHSPPQPIKQKLPTIKPLSQNETTLSVTKAALSLGETTGISPKSHLTAQDHSMLKASKANVLSTKSPSIQKRGSDAIIKKALEPQHSTEVSSASQSNETMAVRDSSRKTPSVIQQEESHAVKKRKIAQSLEACNPPEAVNGTKPTNSS